MPRDGAAALRPCANLNWSHRARGAVPRVAERPAKVLRPNTADGGDLSAAGQRQALCHGQRSSTRAAPMGRSPGARAAHIPEAMLSFPMHAIRAALLPICPAGTT